MFNNTRYIYIHIYFKTLISAKKEFSKKEDKMDYLSPVSCKENTGWLKSQSMQVKYYFTLFYIQNKVKEN